MVQFTGMVPRPHTHTQVNCDRRILEEYVDDLSETLDVRCTVGRNIITNGQKILTKSRIEEGRFLRGTM